MDFMTIGIFAFMIIALGIIVTMFYTNKKLKDDKRELYGILALKDQTIFNYEASRVAVQDVIENISLIDKVTPLLKDGNSREEIAQKLNIDTKRVEIIVKLDKLKKN
ncbi:MAG: sigma-70 family RNA polymerase sigma factor [Sulfurovum sp.]